MSSIFKTPKITPTEQKIEPVIIDNSKQTRELEEARKKRRGAAMQMIAGNTALGKTTLGE